MSLVAEPASDSAVTAAADNAAAARFLKYADLLAWRIATTPKRTKGERTRESLKLGAIRVLEDAGYHAMRVSDICESAKVATATFYLYFENKTDITLQVLSEFQAQGMALMSIDTPADNAFEAIRATNLKWLQVVRANAGLSRCILQLGDEEPGFRELSQRSNQYWYDRIARSVLTRFPQGSLSYDVALLTANALGAMLDEMARKIVTYPDPAFAVVLSRAAATDAEIADFLTVLWHRALYASPIDSPNLGSAARMLASQHAI